MKSLRGEIDRVDDTIASLLTERIDIVEQIKIAKAGSNQVTYQPAREAQILRRLQARNPLLPISLLRAAWRQILNEAVARQGQLKIGFTDAPNVQNHFGMHPDYKIFTDQNELFETLENRDIDLAVITMPQDAAGWELFIQFSYVKIIEKLPDNHFVLSGIPANESGNDHTIIATRYKSAVPAGSIETGATKRATVFDCPGYLEYEYFLSQSADETIIIGHYPVI